MKRKLLGLFLIIGMIFTLAACSDGKNVEEKNPSNKESDKIYYSNLVDQEARMELEASLEAAGLSSTKVISFLEQVDYFNQSIDGYGLVEEAFKDELKIEPDYDPYHMQDLWDESNPNFFGYNCRITSYFLMQDLINVEKVAFQEPYQSIRFKDRAELSDYLLEKYDLSWGQEVASPFIMENDQLMNIEGVENDG